MKVSGPPSTMAAAEPSPVEPPPAAGDLPAAGDNGARGAELPDGLVVRDVTKTFGNTTALKAISTRFVRGKVHGLIGENGSGKSTLVKIASGVYRADFGSLDFIEVPIAGTGASRPARVACVYQDGSLIGELTVAQNLDLIVDPALRTNDGPHGDWRRTVLDDFGLTHVALHARVAQIPTNEARLVEIAAVLARRPDVVFFDESTSTLDERGVARVLQSMRAAAAYGACVVFVTHRLHEVLEVTDDITVLRDGTLVAELPTAGATTDALVRYMAGREVVPFTRRIAVRGEEKAAALQARSLQTPRCGPIDLTVRPGEIVGIGGASGNGQGDLIRALAGDGLSGGDVHVGTVRLAKAEQAMDAGAIFVSSDRRLESLSSLLSIRENTTLALEATDRHWWGVLGRRREVARVEQIADRYDLSRQSIEQPVATLSGGNQQKVAIGRAVARAPKVLLVEEPTEGVDVRSRFDIYRSLVDVADGGTSVVFTSSDAGELRILADRVLVMARGRIVAELDDEQVSEEAIVHAFTTAKDRQEARDPELVRARRRTRRSFTFNPVNLTLLLLFIIALFLYGTARDPQFGGITNVRSILLLSTPLAFAALAQLPVLLVAEIDASVGSMMGLLVVVLSFLPGRSVTMLFVISVLGGGVLGAINAALVVGLRINAVIATIATLGVFLGVGRILRPVPAGVINLDVATTLQQGVANVPMMVVVALGLALAVDAWMNGTRRGLKTRAVGYSQFRAVQLGVHSTLYRALMFVVAGAIAGLGAVPLAAQTGVGDPSVGGGYTLLSIAVPVIGGAMLSGGRGSAVGCVLAAIFVAEVQAFIPFVNLPTGGYLIAVGLLTVLALIAASVRLGALSTLISSRFHPKGRVHA